MNKETDLEFQLLLASLTNKESINSTNWELKLKDENIIGKLFIKPFKKENLLCIDVINFEKDILVANFKSLDKLKDETGISDFDETSSTENEKRMFIFLTYYPEYSKKINIKLRKQLKNKL